MFIANGQLNGNSFKTRGVSYEIKCFSKEKRAWPKSTWSRTPLCPFHLSRAGTATAVLRGVRTMGSEGCQNYGF